MKPPFRLAIRLTATLAALCAAAVAQAQTLPAPGTSPRVDAIKKAGVLRVGVLANAPWLVENTGNAGGETWSGPAWLLAQEYARLLGVKLEPVPVSHETKVPVLASNQVDMSITPLAETPERLRVVDFVIYSATSVCMFGRADNPKIAGAKSVDELNRPDITIAYFTGGGEEGWVKTRFPKAQLRGVVELGLGGAGRGSDGQARRRGADQPRALGRAAEEGQGPGGAAQGEQLPGQHGEVGAGGPGGGQEPGRIPGVVARGVQAAAAEVERRRAACRRHDELSAAPAHANLHSVTPARRWTST